MIKSIVLFTLLGFSFSIYASDVTIVGSTMINNPYLTNENKSAADLTKQKFTLLKIHLSPTVKTYLLNRINQYQPEQIEKTTDLPGKVELGMNQVPVLDQDGHGTCVTFAVTAAVDAALNRGDFISQLCLLELGSTLSKKSYLESGWDGSYSDIVLYQLKAFGIVSKDYQTRYGCAGIKDYMNLPGNGKPMSFLEYKNASNDMIRDNIKWKTIFSLFINEIENNPKDYNDVNRIVYEIKYALSHKQRVLLGFFIDTKDLPIANYKDKNDTWIMTEKLTKQIKEDLRNQNYYLMGHEIVITGYDDNAVAYDENGRAYRGLFSIRNSWGTGVPGKGDQYITYDYVKLLADEAISIQSKTDSN